MICHGGIVLNCKKILQAMRLCQFVPLDQIARFIGSNVIQMKVIDSSIEGSSDILAWSARLKGDLTVHLVSTSCRSEALISARN